MRVKPSIAGKTVWVNSRTKSRWPSAIAPISSPTEAMASLISAKIVSDSCDIAASRSIKATTCGRGGTRLLPWMRALMEILAMVRTTLSSSRTCCAMAATDLRSLSDTDVKAPQSSCRSARWAVISSIKPTSAASASGPRVVSNWRNCPLNAPKLARAWPRSSPASRKTRSMAARNWPIHARLSAKEGCG